MSIEATSDRAALLRQMADQMDRDSYGHGYAAAALREYAALITADLSEVQQAQAPAMSRPFDAVKSFADSVLSMLDERIKTLAQASHPFNDKFGDHPETLVAAKAQESELKEVRWQVRSLGDRALVELMKFKRPREAQQAQAPQAEVCDFVQVEGLGELPRSDAESWLRHRAGIIEACRAEGYTIVTNAQGVQLMKLGKIAAQAAPQQGSKT